MSPIVFGFGAALAMLAPYFLAWWYAERHAKHASARVG